MAYQGFKAVERSAAASGARNPAAVAAAAGRAKYGAKKFESYAAKGKSMRGARPMEHAKKRAAVLKEGLGHAGSHEDDY